MGLLPCIAVHAIQRTEVWTQKNAGSRESDQPDMRTSLGEKELQDVWCAFKKEHRKYNIPN